MSEERHVRYEALDGVATITVDRPDKLNALDDDVLEQLGQAFEQPPKIAINLKTAELIGFDPPIVLLGAADEIFDTITKPE